MMIYDLALSLDPDQQTTLSRWAIKTAMVFGSVNSNTAQWFYSEQERHELAASFAIPDVTLIWLGRSTQSHSSLCLARRLHGDDKGFFSEGYASTFAFAHLIIQVLTLRRKDETQLGGVSISLQLKPGPWNRLVRLWPAAGRSIDWPPLAGSFNDTDIEDLSRRFRAG